MNNNHLNPRKKKHSSSIGRNVQKRAEKLSSRRESTVWDRKITSMIARETVLTLEHLRQIQAFHEKQAKELLQTECDIGTELLQMEARTPRYSQHRFPEREKIHRQLQRLGEEKRRLDTTHHERVQTLETRLLALLEKHSQLDMEKWKSNESRENWNP
jgi:hypothetical protein